MKKFPETCDFYGQFDPRKNIVDISIARKHLRYLVTVMTVAEGVAPCVHAQLQPADWLYGLRLAKDVRASNTDISEIKVSLHAYI